jgi:hypothetical protein
VMPYHVVCEDILQRRHRPSPVVAYVLRGAMTEWGELDYGPGHDRVSLRRSLRIHRLEDHPLTENKPLLGLKRLPCVRMNRFGH